MTLSDKKVKRELLSAMILAVNQAKNDVVQREKKDPYLNVSGTSLGEDLTTLEKAEKQNIATQTKLMGLFHKFKAQ